MESNSKFSILESIKRKGSAHLVSIQERTGLAKTTLREHLAMLERDGFVKRAFIRSGPGRPALEYRLTPNGDALFPSEERELLHDLIVFLQNNGQERLLRNFFTAFWQKRIERAQRLISRESDPLHVSPLKKAQIVLDILETEGFMPECQLDEHTGSLLIRECNCPFKSVVHASHLPCALETGFYAKVFGAEVTRTDFIPNGDSSCTYSIKS